MLEYAGGVINVLEKNVFDSLDAERMINAPNREEAFRVLVDTDLATDSIKNNDLDSILENDLIRLKDFIYNMVKNERVELFWFLFLKFDALNLKIALKTNLVAGRENPYFFKSSIISAAIITKRLSDGHSLANEYLESMVSEATKNIKNSADIEQAVDTAFLKTRLKIARILGGLPLRISLLEIDISNLKNLIKDKAVFVLGGNLTKNDLSILIGKREEVISKGVEKFLEIYNLSLIVKKFKNTGDEKDLEKGLNKFLTNEVLGQERDRGSGIDKIVSFYTRKINAHTNIRLIFFGLENSLTPDEIRDNI